MTLAFSSFVFLLGIGTPVAFAIGCTAVVTLVFTTDVPMALIAHQFFGGMDKFPIMAIPFFVLAGVIMEAGGLSQRVIDFSSALVGWITGSLLMVSVVAATGLAAMSGSGSAAVAAISAIMQPELKKRKYDIDFSAALISTSGTLAQIIPPSIMMVLMAVVNDLSVGALFLAGLVPGLLTVPGLLLIAYVHAKRGGEQYRQVQPFNLAHLGRTFLYAVPALGMIFIILGGILGGVFTPTEAACVAVFYGLFVGIFVYRDLKIGDLPAVAMRATGFSCGILMLIAVGNIFSWLFAHADVPVAIAAWLSGVVDEPWEFLAVVNVFLMVLCMFMETFPTILVLSPVLLPIAVTYGIDPIHFALVFVFNCAIGTVTPPMGGTMFVGAVVAERPIMNVARKLFWPWVAMVVVLILITYVPEVGLFLPRISGFME